jgi:hypothetical protein
MKLILRETSFKLETFYWSIIVYFCSFEVVAPLIKLVSKLQKCYGAKRDELLLSNICEHILPEWCISHPAPLTKPHLHVNYAD